MTQKQIVLWFCSLLYQFSVYLHLWSSCSNSRIPTFISVLMLFKFSNFILSSFSRSPSMLDMLKIFFPTWLIEIYFLLGQSGRSFFGDSPSSCSISGCISPMRPNCFALHLKSEYEKCHCSSVTCNDVYSL